MRFPALARLAHAHAKAAAGLYLTIPDVSEFQRPLDGTYPRPALILRGTFGTWKIDDHFLQSTAAVARLWSAGKLRGGAVLYTVYLGDSTPEAQAAYLWDAIGPKVPDWLTGVMIDVERWPGTTYALSGDHSTPINRLASLHADRLGRAASVKLYANAGDFAELAPRRGAWDVVVASYGPQLTYQATRGAIGQQYTDGAAKWGPTPLVGGRRLPNSTPPFGACDHNFFPYTPDQWRAKWGRPTYAQTIAPGTPAPPVTPPPTVNPGPLPAPSTIPEGDTDMPLLLTVAKTGIPKGKPWPGDFLLSGSLFVKVTSPEDYTSLRKAGAVVTSISYPQYAAFAAAAGK